MFNVAVLRMRDIFKYFAGILLVGLAITMISHSFSKKTEETKVDENLKKGLSFFSENSLSFCLDQTIPTISEVNEEYRSVAKEDDPEDHDLLQAMLNTQISSIKGIEILEAKTKEENNQIEQEEEKTEENQTNQEVVQEGVKTQVITQNPITESFNVQYGKVKIKNQTDYTLTEEMLKPDITIENKNIVIFHTHSCESYTSSEQYPYTPTGNFRTTDLNFTVTRIGTELENQLKQYQYNVIHNADYHDYPAYNGSYTRSLATVENILKTNPSDIIIDLHRDAIGSRSDYAPTVKIGDTEEAAQMMFVIRNKCRWIMASKLEPEFKICNKSSRKSRRNVSRTI